MKATLFAIKFAVAAAAVPARMNTVSPQMISSPRAEGATTDVITLGKLLDAVTHVVDGVGDKVPKLEAPGKTLNDAINEFVDAAKKIDLKKATE